MDRLSEYPKLAFFDIDGTLSIPRYLVGGKLVPGGSNEWWHTYCAEEKHPYAACGVPAQMIELLNELHNNNVELFVLSQESFEDGERAKKDFIKMRYSSFFDDSHILLVSDDSQKVSRMLTIAKERCLDPNRIQYWDDKFANVLDAIVKGIDAHHVSELLQSIC